MQDPDAPIASGKRVFIRKQKIEIRTCSGTLADLKIIAKAWDCSVANVVWAVIVTWINDALRDREVMDLPFSHDARRILRDAHEREREALEEIFGCETPTPDQ